MKKFTAFAVSLLLMLSVFAVTASAAQAKLSESATVIMPKDASATEKYAAQTLQKYFEQVTGVKCAIADDTAAVGGFTFLVGKTALTKTDVAGLADGSYRIVRSGDTVEIIGAGNRGTIYGVYGFLDKVLGCRIFTAEEGLVCTKTEFSIPEDLNIEYNTYFEYTDTDWHSPRDPAYSNANGLSGGVYRSIDGEMGGTVSYLGSFCHTLTNTFCAEEKYFAEHPEYFALHNGVRDPDQLCLTNEDVYNVVLGEVLDLLKEKHDPAAALQIISLTQDDNEDFCECENCKALDDANNSHAGTMITFVNKIAKAVKAQGYDNVAIDTFAYRYTRTTPTNVIPEPNVIVRLCTIECCFSHALDDAACLQNAVLMQDLINWNAICNRLYIWDYTTNYAHTLGIFPDFGVLQKNARIFYEHGVKGIYEEGNYYVDSCNTEFGELRAYLISRVLQDPYCDYSEEMNLFLADFYGAGWQNIREFIDIITENSTKNHVEIYSSMKDSLTLNDDEIAKCDELWVKAAELCENENQLNNIKRSEISWRFWKASVGKGEFAGLAIDAKKALVNDIAASGATMHSEGSDGVEPAPLYWTGTADEWYGGASSNPAIKFIYYAAWGIFAITLVFALIAFIRAIKLKKYIYLVPFPLLAASSEIFMWNKRAYIGWRDFFGLAFTTVFCVLLFAFMYFLSAKAKGKSVKKCIVTAITGAVVFVTLYELTLSIINVTLFNCAANNLAFATAALISSVILIIPVCGMQKNLRKK